MRWEGAPASSLRWSFRDARPESLILPQAQNRVLPDTWNWFRGLRWDGRSHFQFDTQFPEGTKVSQETTLLFVLEEIPWQGVPVVELPVEEPPVAHASETDLPDQITPGEPVLPSASASAAVKIEAPSVVEGTPSAVPPLVVETEPPTLRELSPVAEVTPTSVPTPRKAVTLETPPKAKNPNPSLKVTSKGFPLPGASISTWRAQSGRLVELGETDGNGELPSPLPLNLLGEIFYFRHSCCVSQIRSFPKSVRSGSLQVELEPGVSRDFWVATQAYGVYRGVEKVQLETEGRSLGSTSASGLLQVGGQNLSAGPKSFRLPAVFAPDQALVIEEKSTNSAQMLTASTKEHRKPIVGIVETLNGQIEKSDASVLFDKTYRRLRREFVGQFSRQLNFRPMLGQELVEYFEAVGLVVPRALGQGWDVSALQGEVDFVLWVDRTAKGEVSFVAFNSSGETIWKSSLPKEDFAPEALGAGVFRSFMDQLPLEAVVQDDLGKTSQSLQKGRNYKRVWATKKKQDCFAKASQDSLEGACKDPISKGDVFALCNKLCEAKRKDGLAEKATEEH